MTLRSKDKDGFGLTRRIPRQLSRTVPGDVLACLEAWKSGVTLFKDFNSDDPRHYAFLEELIRAIVALDRRNQLSSLRELEKTGFCALLGPILAQRKDDAYAPDYVDLWNLHRYIRQRRPRCVLELGSGISTLAMAHALHQNGEGGRLYSVEPSEEWEAETRRLLPGELAGLCEVGYSPSAACRVNGVETRRFAKMPDVVPDFIYLDGAPAGAEFLGAEEVCLLEDRLSPGAAVMIDGRAKAMLFFLAGSMKRKWEVEAQALWVQLPPPIKTNFRFGLDQYANCLCILAN